MRPCALRVVLLLSVLGLSGCAHQTCLRAAEAELRALDAQIAESEQALARGFRVTLATEPRTVLNICAWPREPVLFCTTHTPGQRATRINVLPVAEEARLAELRRERARLVVVTADRVAACPA
ncbi:MAG: hypothetical protein EA339_03145 [Rhodobacteraceae bacterium]|nr:MAG: hypothetical protein EA339_03145 [Paracoccaceae bacterium]